jgi:hypothetical protein
MAERIVSPGVFTREVDQSFLPAAIGAIGAAVVGPTVKGPAMVPTMVSSYGEYVQLFGDTFTSGSGADEDSYKYLTSISAQNYLRYGDTLTVTRILEGAYGAADSYVTSSTGGEMSFRLHALSDGDITNSGQSAASAAGAGITADETINSALVSGSKDNLRWEVANVNNNLGTFTLFIRRGDDTIRKKSIVEQYNNITLDPNSPNFIAARIGDQVYTIRDTGGNSPFLQLSGSYPNRSKYVRVSEVKTTINYLDSNGNVRVGASSASLPQAVSGTFANGSNGTVAHPQKFFNTITATNSQGYNPNTSVSYGNAINLLSNQDEYDINLLSLPGCINSLHPTILSAAETMVEGRGDCFLISDPIAYGSGLSAAQAQAEGEDSSYNAMYWPWLQVRDNDLGKNIWVPATTLIPGVYAFNDMVAAPWFAPAGLNRGGLESVLQAERKLTQTNRDDLYESNVNPIATFPNTGVVVFGQKTLQKKASALDRINVRRLLIASKKFIASASKYLIFEQNTTATRNRFLSIANPYFEDIQQRQGLYAFKVVMDETNNTPDVVDRNQLVGQIFLQPSKTAEFIIIDFNVLPTGAAFPE